MAEPPLPPRLAKLLTEAARRGVPEKGCAVAAVLSAGERGSSDLLTLVESDWQPQTQPHLRPTPPRMTGRDRTRISQRPTPRFCNPCWPRFRTASRATAATGICCSPPADRRAFRIAATNFWSLSTWKSVVSAELAAGPPGRAASNPSGCSTAPWSAPTSNGIARPNASNRSPRCSTINSCSKKPARPPDPAKPRALLAAKALEADIGRFADRDELNHLLARAAFAGIEIDVEATLRELCTGPHQFRRARIRRLSSRA